MSYSKVSVLIPTRNRIGYLKNMLKSYEETVVNPAQSEFVFRVDSDDVESANFLAPLGWSIIIGPRREGYKSLPGFYNEMVKQATGDLFICGNDDMIFQTRDWPRLVIEEANKYPDGIFNIGVSTGLNDDKFPFSIVSRQLVERLGKINDERLLFSDIFLLDVARHFNRAVPLRSVIFSHDWAGNTDDETRRDAQQHEFSEVWGDIPGDWSDAYRSRHDAVVLEATIKLDPNSDLRINKALEQFARYRTGQDMSAIKIWGADGSAEGIHYGLEETRALLRALLQSGVRRNKAVITSFRNGLPSLLWGTLFEQVTTISEQPGKPECVSKGQQSVVHGQVGNTRFLYSVIDHVGRTGLLVLDGRKYSEIISPYYIFKNILTRPGMIVFANASGKGAIGPGVPRFIADLRSGGLDGVRHDLVDIMPQDGSGFCYELVK